MSKEVEVLASVVFVFFFSLVSISRHICFIHAYGSITNVSAFFRLLHLFPSPHIQHIISELLDFFPFIWHVLCETAVWY